MRKRLNRILFNLGASASALLFLVAIVIASSGPHYFGSKPQYFVSGEINRIAVGVNMQPFFDEDTSHTLLTLTALPAFWLIHRLARTFQNQRRQQHTASNTSGRCPTCSYDLRATPTRCPECGHTP